MGRWSQYDSDGGGPPEGMTRIGYDADEQTSTYRDRDGSIWESAPGNEHFLTRVSGPVARTETHSGYNGHGNDNDTDEEPPPPYIYDESVATASWRADMMPLLNFFMIIALFLIGVFYYLRNTAGKMDEDVQKLECGRRNTVYHVQSGDTCWALADTRGLTVDDLLKENANLDCDKLMVGQTICVPTT